MEDNIRISSSVVSRQGEGRNVESYFINGKFPSHVRSEILVCVDSTDDLQLFAVGKGMELGRPGGRSSVSVSMNGELAKFIKKNAKTDMSEEDLFDSFYEMANETENLLNSIRNSTDVSEITTPSFAAIMVKNDKAVVVSLGDTRIYRARNGSLKQLTSDNRRTERLLKLGIITDDQAEVVADRLGESDSGDGSKLKRTEVFEIYENDVFVLCNSGVLDRLDEDGLLYLMSSKDGTDVLADTIMDEITKRGLDADLTLQVIRIEQAGAEGARTRVVPRAAAASGAGSISRYTSFAARRPVGSSAKRRTFNKAKIKRAIRLVFSTVVIFAIVIGLFSIIQMLLFPKDREAGGDYDNTTPSSTGHITSGTIATGTYATEPTEQPTTPTQGNTQPTSQPTSQPTNQGSTSTSTPEGRKYVVKKGDTLMSIARQFYNDASKYRLIQEANGIDDPNHIEVGQELIIPELD